MRPAERQQHHRIVLGPAGVDAVVVADEDDERLLVQTGHVPLEHVGPAALCHPEIDHRGRAGQPEEPAVAGLALDFLENLPSRLVAVEQPLLKVPFQQRVPQRLKQRHQLLKTASQRPRCDGCAQAFQIRAQAVGGDGVKVFAQQHFDPHRDALVALRNQARRGRRGDHARHIRALAGFAVAHAFDFADIGTHLDFDDFGIFRPRKGGKGQSAAGACLGLGRQRPHLLDHRQQRADGAAMALAPRHLAAGARRLHPARLCLRCRGALLAPFAVEPLLKVADSRLRKLQLLFEDVRTSRGAVVLALPVAAIPFKLDVLLLGQ